jgi:hypothetical protein
MAPIRDEYIGGVAAAGDGGEIYPLRRLRRYVFQRVHGEVYLTRKERLVELAGEDVSLVDDGERRVRMVLAGRPDDTHLDLDARGVQGGCALFGLSEG